ncbi:MAG: T9SS type A sorting domain-containing protein [Chitinophagales bacterium]
MKNIYILLCISLWSNFSSAQCNGGRFDDKVFTEFTRTKNISFNYAANSAGYYQNVLMDVYEPKNDTMQLRPLIIFMHGGAYWTGTKDYQSQVALGEEFAKRGYVFSSATYRLEASFVSLLFQDKMLKAVGRGVQDTKKLVQYFFNSARDSSNPFRIDTTKIFLCGGSAGAFNVMHTVYLDSTDNLNPDWKAALNQIGGVFGTYDFIDFGKKIKGVVNVNGALGDKSYMDNNHTPFLSVHNIYDPEIPFNRGRPYSIPFLMEVDGSNVLHAKAQQLGIYNPFYIIPDNGHTSYSSDFFGTVVQPFFDSTVWYMKEFFIHELCNSTPTAIRNNTVEKVKVYPNPTDDIFYLDGLKDFVGQTISIRDISGKEVYRTVFTGKLLSSKDIGLTSGTYIIQLTNERTQQTQIGKILIE